MLMRTEERQTKQSDMTQWTVTIREHQNFLEEGKFIVGGASVACVVSHRCPIFMVFGIM